MPDVSDAFQVNPVGWVRSAHRDPSDMPHQGRDRDIEAEIELRPDLEPAYREIRAGMQIWVLSWFHLAERDVLRVHPRGDPNLPLTGVFATRSPVRPNPIGLSLVDVLSRTENRIRVRGLEAVDGTPVIDLKPHLAHLDR